MTDEVLNNANKLKKRIDQLESAYRILQVVYTGLDHQLYDALPDDIQEQLNDSIMDQVIKSLNAAREEFERL